MVADPKAKELLPSGLEPSTILRKSLSPTELDPSPDSSRNGLNSRNNASLIVYKPVNEMLDEV
jgi:hypothetical protein